MQLDFDAIKARLTGHLQQIARPRDPFLASEGHFFVRQYVREQLAQWGAIETHRFSYQSRTYENLILNLPGTRSTAPILVGAHFDAIPGTPGADDNASGVAVLLELARSIHHAPARSPICFVAFDLEEYGLVGSRAYANDLQEPLKLMLSLEMLGYCDRTPGSQKYPANLQYFYPNQGDFIALAGNWRSIFNLLKITFSLRQSGVSTQFLPAGDRGLFLPMIRRSDHAPFWDLGYPAILVTDTADCRNPHYHQPSDRLETLDLNFLTSVCVGLAESVRHL
ncbi:MAG: M28 family peptidase [Leptolyngbyaceae cyanobacterium SM1_3_5]|nr:M28 family peptidase [Leptolyngbyaceae cyanobacterium SM1_3_5]